MSEKDGSGTNCKFEGKGYSGLFGGKEFDWLVGKGITG